MIKKVFECIGRFFVYLAILTLIWQLLEKWLLGAINPNIVDTIIACLLCFILAAITSKK